MECVEFYGTVTVMQAVETNWTTPPQLHMHHDELFSAGLPPTVTVGEPGTHGAATTGRHGIGVSTPSAATVAAATVGLAMLMHAPKGTMLTSGTLSMMVPTGVCPATVVGGTAMNDDGAIPKLHFIIEPMVTSNAMAGS